MSKIDTTEQKEKQRYKITNWPLYNAGLVKRRSLTLWLDEAIDNCWCDNGPVQRGAQYQYSNDCIKCMLTLKGVFGLPYRQT